jgi:hypothetical protein
MPLLPFPSSTFELMEQSLAGGCHIRGGRAMTRDFTIEGYDVRET